MKKIMFNTKYGLEQAVLSGIKTTTRRMVPKKVLERVQTYQEEYYNGTLSPISEHDAIYALTHYEQEYKLPFGENELVAIAQSYKDCGYPELCGMEFHGEPYFVSSLAGWNNKMFVDANHMKHHIRMTNLRIERLQDISDEDCLKEGIQEFKTKWDETYFSTLPDRKEIDRKGTPRLAFAALIDKLSGTGTWKSNPWVYVYEFELVD